MPVALPGGQGLLGTPCDAAVMLICFCGRASLGAAICSFLETYWYKCMVGLVSLPCLRGSKQSEWQY